MFLYMIAIGDKLRADDGFDCLQPGQICEVMEDEGGLFVICGVGRHYLDGQLDAHRRVIGFTKV